MAMNYQTKITLPPGGGQIIREAMEKLIADSIDLGALAWVADYDATLSALDGDEMAFPCQPDIARVYRAFHDAASPLPKISGMNMRRDTLSVKRTSNGMAFPSQRADAASNLYALLGVLIPGRECEVVILWGEEEARASKASPHDIRHRGMPRPRRSRRIYLCKESRRGLEALGHTSPQKGVRSILSIPAPPMFSIMEPRVKTEGVKAMEVVLSASMFEALLFISADRINRSAAVRDLIRAHVAELNHPPR